MVGIGSRPGVVFSDPLQSSLSRDSFEQHQHGATESSRAVHAGQTVNQHPASRAQTLNDPPSLPDDLIQSHPVLTLAFVGPTIRGMGLIGSSPAAWLFTQIQDDIDTRTFIHLRFQATDEETLVIETSP